MKHEFAIPLLVHEFSHMQQWIENSKVWSYGKYLDDVDRWLVGDDVKDIDEKINKIQLLELDCERRAVKYILKYSLPINLKIYCQKANAYLFFYTWMRETRTWSREGNSSYADKNIELRSKCPTKLKTIGYYRTIPKNIHKKFIECGI